MDWLKWIDNNEMKTLNAMVSQRLSDLVNKKCNNWQVWKYIKDDNAWSKMIVRAIIQSWRFHFIRIELIWTIVCIDLKLFEWRYQS